MSEQVGSIHYTLDLDAKKFQQGVQQVAASNKSLESRFNAAAAASKKLLLGVGALGVGLGGLIGYGAKVAADLESSRQGFITLLGSAKEADATLALIKKDAASTPFELPGLIKANQLLTAVTKDGVKSEKLLMDVGKALAAMGRGQPELDRIIVNLQQIGASGRATMQDIRQFAIAGIPIFEMLAESTGKTGDSLDEMISNGEVTFEMLTEMFDKASNGSGRFADAFKNQAGTFNQLMSNMKDSISIAAATILTESGVFDILKNAIAGVTTFISDHQEDIINWIKASVEFAQNNLPAIAIVLLVTLIPAFIALGAAIWSSMAPLLPFIAAGLALAAVVQAIVDKIGGWQVVMDALGKFIEDYVKPTIETLKEKWQQLQPALEKARDSFISTAEKGVKPIQQAFEALKWVIENWFIPSWNRLRDSLGDKGTKFLQALAVMLAVVLVSAVFSTITVLIGLFSVLSLIFEIVKAIVDAVSSLGSTLKDTFSGKWLTQMKIPGRALGGSVGAGQPYYVGEKGTELFVPDTPGRIVPNNQLGNISPSKGGGGSTFIFQADLSGILVTDRKQARDVSLLLMEEFNKEATAKGWTPVGDGKVVAP